MAPSWCLAAPRYGLAQGDTWQVAAQISVPALLAADNAVAEPGARRPDAPSLRRTADAKAREGSGGH